MSWDELYRVLESGTRTVVLPTGSTEQHGYHLPLCTDSFAAEAIAEAIALRLNAILAPPIRYGTSSNHIRYSGTVSVRNETLVLLVSDVLLSLAQHGVERVAIINGHGNNLPALQAAARDVKDETGLVVTISNYWRALDGEYSLFADKQMSFREFWAHGGLMESALIVSAVPGSVDLRKATKGSSRTVEILEDPSTLYPADAEELASSGSYGDPTNATPELGRRIIDRTAEILSDKLIRLWKELENNRARVLLPGGQPPKRKGDAGF